MELLRLLWNASRSRLLVAVFLSIGVGMLNSSVLVVILRVVQGKPVFGIHALVPSALLYAGLALIQVLCGYGASALVALIPAEFVTALRVDVIRRMLGVPLVQFERLGPDHVTSALTDQFQLVRQGASSFPMVFSNSCVLIVGMIYLVVVAPISMLFVLLAMISVSGAFLIVQRKRGAWARAQFAADKGFLAELGAAIGGAKELRLNAERRRLFLADHLAPSAYRVRDNQRLVLLSDFVVGALVNTTMWLMIGAAVFLAPALGAHSNVDVVMFLVYLTQPIVLTMLNALVAARGSLALQQIKQLQHELESGAEGSLTPPFVLEREIALRGVTHAYHREDEGSSFQLGPIDLELKLGEIVFLVGSNGSGKTTLAKLLVGLYRPEQGEIRVDGHVVEAGEAERYRQLFSAVFTDYYLFDWHIDGAAVDETAQRLLEDFRLTSRVRAEGGRFSTVKLSTGQRKRLALVASYLENRDVYLFDEWAADQDPVFKKVFYETLLPALRARGKACFVVSHDAHFLHVADRVLRLEEGRLVTE